MEQVDVELFFQQPTSPVGPGFGFPVAESAATALPAQMTPIINATNPLRSISAPSMESADRPHRRQVQHLNVPVFFRSSNATSDSR